MMFSQFMFNDACSPTMESLILFHEIAMTMLAFISIYVMMIFMALLLSPFSFKSAYEDHNLESLWTLMPAGMLIILALPSLRLLYMMDDVLEAPLTVKVVGHQWYWSYDHNDLNHMEYDSYMMDDSEMLSGSFRLLETDNSLVLPYGMSIRLIITAADVIHSWTVPSLGVKVDAVPGRLNQASFFPLKPGIYFGQCSEICGANHSFMPIEIQLVEPPLYVWWLMLEDFE